MSLELIQTKDLKLDSQNPRLPENIHGKPQAEILEYLRLHGHLEELAHSLLDNGYFQAEPLVVDNDLTVLEGNRRLATLHLLASPNVSEYFPFLSQAQLEKRGTLASVPVVRVADRAAADSFIAFRHIGGLKEWEPEAKARYVFRAVNELVDRGDKSPFQTLASRVGSSAHAMRSSYLAMALLKHAHDEHGVDTVRLQDERFGVWSRAMSSRDIRDYMELGDARSVEEVHNAVHRVNSEALRRVIGDLTPGRSGPSVITDSRQLSTYGKILRHERAFSVFCKFGFDAASRIVEVGRVAERLRRIIVDCKDVTETILEAEIAPDSETANETKRLENAVFLLSSTVKARTQGT